MSIEERNRPGRNFAPMPLAVLASDAPPRAKLLILALYHHDWDGNRAWPSQDRLSMIMSCSRDTVGLATKDCIDRGWIIVKRRFSKSSIYDLNIPDMNLQKFEAVLSQLSVFTTKGKNRDQLSENQGSVVVKPDTNENKEPEQINENQHGFEKWWNIYPNKAARARALKAWKKLKPNSALQAVLTQDITLRARSEMWTKEGGQYVPHGATYLNQERWTDPLLIESKVKISLCPHPIEKMVIKKVYGDGTQVGSCGICHHPMSKVPS